ncbi:MAG: enoyl-CoA hydratase/isomerase family protein [Usitatibacter sp.]
MTIPETALTVERRGGTLTLTLNRPEKMNALSAGLVDALLAAVDAAYRDGTRLMVLRGNGKNFSAGFDMGGYEAQSEGDLVLRFIRIEQLLQAVRHAPFDTLVLAHGRNFGAGVDLICACAHRIATADATFRMPGLHFGLVLGSRLFAERVGLVRARQVLQVSQTFTSTDAQSWGFLTDVKPQEQWAEAIEGAEKAASHLSAEAAARLFRVTARAEHRDADLAELVRSAAEPGLKQRIAAYLGSK